MNVIDNHIHVGWYTNGYNSPREVWNSIIEAGVDEFAVSSTSVCAELYDTVIDEIRELISLGGESVHPILWVTPLMMKTQGVKYMLQSGIKWQGVKMHWDAHKDWCNELDLVNKVVGIARSLNVPILLHTGETAKSMAENFKDLCRFNQDVKFVLAHGRPLEQTLSILKLYPNTYMDAAFMPIENVQQLVNEGLINRILFGTDMPINKVYYTKISNSQYIKNCLSEIRNNLSEDEFKQIMRNQVYI